MPKKRMQIARAQKMAEDAMELFWEDLDAGEVYIRDKWQFALKSDFFPQKTDKRSVYTQEFYLFIPNSLQINNKTYSKEAFYLDQTNLIRYKTPEFTFQQLLDSNSKRSPLTRIHLLCDQAEDPQHQKALSDELKLLANAIRSTLRREVKALIFFLRRKKSPEEWQEFIKQVVLLCGHIKNLRERYGLAEKKCLDNWRDPLFYRQMLYIDEFLSYSISYYLTGLLESIRLTGRQDLTPADEALCEILLSEKQLSDFLTNSKNQWVNNPEEAENVLYRYSLLNKFALDALHLTTNRFSLDERYQHWISGVSAGVAMGIYFTLFVFLGNVFVINSAPFVLITVIIYILKDRIKDWLKNYSYLQASRWFPDYTTVIQSQDKHENVGIIKESFSFIDPSHLSKNLHTMRNAEFHTVLETVKRPENIIFYKRVVELNPQSSNALYSAVNIIFRFNIHHFLRKASDPTETHLAIDPQTKKLVSIRFPKVYHLNLIIRSTSIEENNQSKIELKKLRIVIDKNGIKRIEQLGQTYA